jgi:hypothetical protein
LWHRNLSLHFVLCFFFQVRTVVSDEVFIGRGPNVDEAVDKCCKKAVKFIRQYWDPTARKPMPPHMKRATDNDSMAAPQRSMRMMTPASAASGANSVRIGSNGGARSRMHQQPRHQQENYQDERYCYDGYEEERNCRDDSGIYQILNLTSK